MPQITRLSTAYAVLVNSVGSKIRLPGCVSLASLGNARLGLNRQGFSYWECLFWRKLGEGAGLGWASHQDGACLILK